MKRTIRISLIAAAIGTLIAAMLAVPAGASDPEAKATLRNASGDVIGIAKVSQEDDGAHFKVTVWGVPAGFHGFHVHANGDDSATPGFGTGCDASNGFRSADGHYKDSDSAHASHGSHNGDLPVMLVNGATTGTYAESRFVTNLVSVSDLVATSSRNARALILHAKPDNYGNVPIDATNGYTANGTAAASTAATGDAGGRIGCGLFAAA